MPGYTEEQLEAKRANVANYVGCLNCRLHWHRRSFEKHLNIVPWDERVPKGRPIAIIHPAWAEFIDFLVEGTIKQLMEERAEKSRTGEPIEDGKDPIADESLDRPPPEHEVLTVDEAVARFGVSREAILAEFEKNKIPFDLELRTPEARLAQETRNRV